MAVSGAPTNGPLAPLACCRCRGPVVRNTAGLRCTRCAQVYPFNRHGFVELLPADLAQDSSALDTTTADYAKDQHSTGARVLNDYLIPLLQNEPFHTVLDVGCGIGAGIRALAASGYEAYGVDLPAVSRFWAEAGNDPDRFIGCNALRLPFANDSFDVVYSLGVIEHVGTAIGHCTLRPDFQVQRQRYVDEIIRVTKPGGRVIIACPNKAFPVDIQHGPSDAAGPGHPIRSSLFERTGINLHKTWGTHHLLSYGEVKRLFCDGGRAQEFQPLSLAGYFGFGRFKRGFLRPFGVLAEIYVRHLPRRLRASFMNPYVLVQIRK